MKPITISIVALLLFIANSCNSGKSKPAAKLDGKYHDVMAGVSAFLPTSYAYFNLKANNEVIKKRVDPLIFEKMEQFSNAVYGSKLFVDTASMRNSVTFFTNNEYIPINKESVQLLMGMLPRDANTEISEEPTILTIGDKKIFKMKHRLLDVNQYKTFYLISSKPKTIGVVVIADNDDLVEYVKKIKL